MRVKCEVIRDLLPLYIEGMGSTATCELVEEHLEQCEGCRKIYGELQVPIPMQIEDTIEPLRKVNKALKKKKYVTILMTSLLVLMISFLMGIYISTPEYLPYDEQLMVVTDIDGYIRIQFNETVGDYSVEKYLNDDGEGYVYHIKAWKSIWENTINQKALPSRIINSDGENVTTVYYSEANGMPDTLIYGEPLEGEGVVSLPRLFLTYYAIIAAGVLLLLSIGLIMVRKLPQARRVVEQLIGIPMAYLLAHLLVKGFSGATYAPVRDLCGILLLMLPIYFLLYCGKNFINKIKSM